MSEQPKPQTFNDIKKALAQPEGEAFVNDKFVYDENETEVILEMYKTYVDTTTQVTNWRNTANAFFITLNSLVVTLVSIFGNTQPVFVIVAVTGLIAVNIVWWSLIQYYADLNDSKFKVVKDFESLLPVMPFFSREWDHYHAKLVGSSKKHKLLSMAEKQIPIILICVYVIGLAIYIVYSVFAWLFTLLGVF